MSIVFEVQALLTTACNLRCRYCRCPSLDTPEVTTGEWVGIIRRFAGLGTQRIKFQGGEPTVRKDFGELCRAARRVGITTAVVTNGLRIAAEPGLLEDLDEVVVSLDNVTPALHDELNIWAFALDSAALADFVGALKYGGHGLLWPISVSALAKVVPDPLAMQCLNVAFATLAVWVVLRYAPLPAWQALPFVFGYAVFFEYAILSRHYALGLLCLVAALAFLAAPRPRLVPAALCPALLAQGRASEAAASGPWEARLSNAGIFAVLAIQLAAGWYASAVDLVRPFSASQAAAAWIRENRLDDRAIVADRDQITLPVLARLDRPRVLFPRSGQTRRLLLWNARRLRPLKERDLLAAVAAEIARPPGRVLLVTSYPLRGVPPDLRQVARFEAGIVSSERYYLYRN